MFNIFKDNSETAQAVRTLTSERDMLKTDIEDLEKKLRGLEHDHKLADEDIKHMVKIKEEHLAIEHDKKVLELERAKQEEIAKVKDQYRDKMEEHLGEQVINVRGMYDEILKRLPDINVELSGKVGK